MKAPGFNVGPNYLVDERGGGGDYISGFGINPADPDHVIVTDWMQCYITRDGGQTWMTAHTRSAEPPGRRGKGMRWINTGLVVTTVWINQSQPLLWPKDFDVDPLDSRTVYLGASDAKNAEGGLYKTTDGGATWTRVARKGTECFGATVHPRKPNWVYLCITESAPDAGLWLSQDGGKNWTALEGLPFRNAQRVTFDPNDDSIIYVSTFGGSVWKGPAEP